MWLTRTLASASFLFAIVISIPLAFDVGGRTCGLAFSLSLATFYFSYSILRLATPDNSRFRWLLLQATSVAQWMIIPTLLIWSLNRFSVDGGSNRGWIERTFNRTAAIEKKNVKDWIFGPDGVVETTAIGSWSSLLLYSTPFFQLVEGFCSLLVIQAAGQISRHYVNRSSDWLMITLLVVSASVITSAVYFLWRITQFPEIGNVDASLIGVCVTCAVFLCAWGIGSKRGNPVESSLLFAYVVLCMYQIFTDYMPSHPHSPPLPSSQPDFPPFPPIIMASYSTLMHALSTLPSTFLSSFNFIMAALSTITPSVLISLVYRTTVLYAATRIIPAVRESGARALSQEPSLDDSDGAGRLLGFLSWFSPSILIAVYTSLLMQHFKSSPVTGSQDVEWRKNPGDYAGSNIWQWVNVVGTMALYALELYLGKDEMEGGVTGHWKSD